MTEWKLHGYMTNGKLYATKAVHESGFEVSFGAVLNTKHAMKEARRAFEIHNQRPDTPALSSHNRSTTGE